jgi:MFS family permease
MKQQLSSHFSDTMSKADFESNFELLYSVYSMPNVILPFFGGIMVDKLGTRATLVGFNVVLTVASAFVALGCSWGSMGFMIFGRVVYGLAGESLTVVQSAILTQWFKGKELALTFGISLAFSRGGSVLNNYSSPAFAQWRKSPTASFFLGTALLGTCTLTAVLYAWLDRNSEQRIAQMEEARLLSTDGSTGIRDAVLPPCSHPVTDVSDPQARKEAVKADDSGVGGAAPGAMEALWAEISNISSFPLLFWLVTASAVKNAFLLAFFCPFVCRPLTLTCVAVGADLELCGGYAVEQHRAGPPVRKGLVQSCATPAGVLLLGP